MDRKESLDLLRHYIRKEGTLRHSLETEAVMRALARRFDGDADKWGLAGLLHDIDIELVNGNLTVHGKEGARILEEKGLDSEAVEAVRLHNSLSHVETRRTVFQKALASCEQLDALFNAIVQSRPGMTIRDLEGDMVVRKLREPNFAHAVDRSTILECEQIGFTLHGFANFCLNAIKEAHIE